MMRAGNTARKLATSRVEVARVPLMYRGVVPVVTDLGENVDATGETVARDLVVRGLLRAGDEVVFVSAHEDVRRAGTNFIKLYRV